MSAACVSQSCFSAKGDLQKDPAWTTYIDNELGDRRKVNKLDQALKHNSDGNISLGEEVEEETPEYMKGTVPAPRSTRSPPRPP